MDEIKKDFIEGLGNFDEHAQELYLTLKQEYNYDESFEEMKKTLKLCILEWMNT